MIELGGFVSKHYLQTKMNNNRLYCTQIGNIESGKKDASVIITYNNIVWIPNLIKSQEIVLYFKILTNYIGYFFRAV